MLAPTAVPLGVAAALLRRASLTAWLLWGYERLLRARRRRHEPRPPPLFAAPAQRRAARGRVRAGAAPRGGDLGRRRDYSTAGDAAAAAARTWWRVTAAAAGSPGRSSPSRWPASGRAVPADRCGSRCSSPAACALALARANGRMRRFSQTARLAVFFLALLAPAVAMYPSLLAHATDAKERLIATTFGPQAASLREDLQQAAAAGGRADRRDSVARRAGPPRRRGAGARSDARVRGLVADRSGHLSADVGGRALQRGRPPGQRVPAEPARVRHDRISIAGVQLGRTVRRGVAVRIERAPRLRIARGVCVRGRMVGSIVVRVMLDYRTLPFISSQSPYLESLRPNRQVAPEGVSGRDVEFIVYGWSRAPIFESGTRVWTLPDPVFQRLVESRDPFWATLDRDDQTFRVYFLSDRGGIYALGYPVISWVGHLINLAELVMLAVALYASLLAGLTLFSALGVRTATERPRPAPRSAVQLLPQAVPRVLGRRGRAGVHPGDLHPDLRRDAADRRRGGSGRQGGDHGAAPGRGLRGAAAARRRRRSTLSTIRSWCWFGARSTRT